MIARFRKTKRREEASCYACGDSLFLCAVSEIRDGPGVEWEPYCRLSSADSDEVVGKTLTEILDGSGLVIDVESPTELRDARKKQLRAAGFSSERDLMKRAVLCLVKRLPASIKLTPTHNGGNRGDTKGFHGLEERATTISFPVTDAEIGAALRAALRSCTGSIDAPND